MGRIRLFAMAPFSLADLAHPIVQAPLGGGPSTPALSAAVSRAGGLGFLAAGYKNPEAVRRELAELRSLLPGGAPFGGFKASGLGRELGPDAPDAFTEVKNVFIATD